MSSSTFFKSRPALLALLVASLGASQAAHAQFNTNLIVNGGAEAVAGGDGSYAAGALPGWTVTGELTNISYALGCPSGYPCASDPGPSNRGLNMFGGGNVALSTGTQNVNLGFANGAINGNGAYFSLAGWLGGYASQADNARLSVDFLNASNQVIGSRVIGPVSAADRANATSMVYQEAKGWVPLGAVSANVSLQMTRAGGTSNDGYADSLSLSLMQGNVAIHAPTAATVGSFITAQVAVNSPFTGSYSADELLAFGFDLGYDTSRLRLTSAVVAGGWDDDSALFSDISVAGSHFPGLADPGTSDVSLATLTFEVLAAGDAFIEVHSDSTSNLSEGMTFANGSNLELFGRTSLALSAAAAVPEPTGALLALGGVALLALRRKRA